MNNIRKYVTKIGTVGENWHSTTQKVENSDKNVKGNTQAQDKYALQVWSVCSKKSVNTYDTPQG